MQVCKTRAIGADGERRAITRAAARTRRPIEGAVRQNQSGIRLISVAVGLIRIRKCRETMQNREGLCRHPTSQYQAEACQDGQEGQVFNAGFHWLVPPTLSLGGERMVNVRCRWCQAASFALAEKSDLSTVFISRVEGERGQGTILTVERV